MKQHELLAEVLKNIGLLNEEQIRKAVKEHKNLQERMGQILVRLGFVPHENLDAALLAQFGITPSSITSQEIPEDLLSRVPQEAAARHRILPIKMQDGAVVLISDQPYSLLGIENFSSLFSGLLTAGVTPSVEGIWVDRKVFENLYARHYGGVIPQTQSQAPISKATPVNQAKLTTSEEVSTEEGPIIQLATLLVEEGVKARASDIHVEPLEGKLRVRYRIDGVLHEVKSPPQRLQGPLISRIKIMAGMNIAEKRLPQDGRIKLEVAQRELDLRVSSLPALYGESIVMRILDKSSFLLGIKDLGFLPGQQKLFEQLVNLPTGIFLVTGPTGSGKTTTLYAALCALNKTDRKLITVEDPVEYQITGINQVQVRPQIQLTFAAALRSMLRQSPDVIMVGEIRDAETAAIAIQAALTGHLILSTLHTNDAPGAVTRLVDMGMKPYLVASTLQGVLAQRLVRTICPSCKEPYTPTPSEMKVLEEASETGSEGHFLKGKGCDQCSQTGFRGRIGIYELFRMQEPIRQLILRRSPSTEIRAKARESGMKTLREDGLMKVKLGWSTVEEVLRATQADEG